MKSNGYKNVLVKGDIIDHISTTDTPPVNVNPRIYIPKESNSILLLPVTFKNSRSNGCVIKYFCSFLENINASSSDKKAYVQFKWTSAFHNILLSE